MKDFLIFLKNGNIQAKMPLHSMVFYRKIRLSILGNILIIMIASFFNEDEY